MKIQVLSDLHLEFDDFEFVETDADVVVLAGDIHVIDKGVWWAIENIKNKPVIYVLGNHEFYGTTYPNLINTLKETVKNTNVQILENDTVTIEGVNFIGCTLWTDFALLGDPRIAGYQCQQIMSDFKQIRISPSYSKLRSIDVAMIHRQSLQWLKSELEKYQGERNVVITHHGPSPASLPSGKEDDISSSAFVSQLEYVMKEFEPNYWIHGHMHNSSNYLVGSCRVICNPRGYPHERNPDFRQDFTIELQKLSFPDDISLLATTIFGSSVKADRWLRKPNRALNGDTPISRLSTNEGLEEVRSILRKIEYGDFS